MSVARELTAFRHRPVVHRQGVPALSVKGLGVSYGPVVALQDVSFDVEAGSQVAVVGPNGSGKSTLLMAIAGVLESTRGQVSVFGSQPGDHCCISYVPQRSQVDWDFPVSVADVVMMGRVKQMGWFRWPRREDREAVAHGLDVVGLGSLARRQIDGLSGGQKQRVFIARALAQEAQLMLLDEPLAGLDWPSQQEVLEVLTGLRAHGVTVLFSTHNLNLAARHFDEVLLLNRRLVGFGSAEAVLTREHLVSAYGEQMGMTAGGAAFLEDACCGGREYE